MYKYVPVIRWKRGEQNGIYNLDTNVKDQVLPLIEVPFTPTAENNMKESFEKYWTNRDYFFYLHNDWYEDCESIVDIYEKYNEQYNKLNHINAIRVFDLSNMNSEFKEYNRNISRMGIRIQNSEFEHIEKTLNKFVRNDIISPNITDLILDLGYIYPDDYFTKSTFLKAILVDLEQLSEYHSIIISSCSFPNSLSNVDSHKIYNYPRKELDLTLLSDSLSKKMSFNYIYSDHGPSDLEDIEFVIGMIPCFKIRYSTFDQYLYIKGLSIKKGGLDIDQVIDIAKLLTDRPDFSGENFSWGDSKIYSLANGLSDTSGNLTSWISYSINHHITLIINQL